MAGADFRAAFARRWGGDRPAGNPPRAFPRHRRRNRGFTALELLGAMVLSLILLTVGMAGFRLYERELPLSGAAGRLTHGLATARTMAIARNSTFTVVIDRRFNHYYIDETDRFGGVLAPQVVAPESFGEQVIVESILPLNASVVRARFFPDGSSDELYIHMKLANRVNSNDEADVTTVRLYGPTGQSRVFENQRLTEVAAVP
jgi:hypothetical protein